MTGDLNDNGLDAATSSLRSADSLDALNPPSLVRLALAVLRRQFNVRTVADLAALDLRVAESIKGVGRQKLDVLKELQARARAVCGREGASGTGALQQALMLEGHQPPEVGAGYVGQGDPTGVVLDSNHVLGRILACAAHFGGVRTLKDLLELDLPRVLEAAVPAEERETPLADLVPAALNDMDPVAVLERALAMEDDRGRLILEKTTLATKDQRMTLEQLAAPIGVTRERVRQVKLKVDARFSRSTARALEPAAAWYRPVLGPVVRLDTAMRQMTVALGDSGPPLRSLAAQAILVRAGYKLGAEWALQEGVDTELAAMKEALREASRARAVIPNEAIDEFVRPLIRDEKDLESYLSTVLKLPRMEGRWIRNDSARARVTAALVILGRPASRDEVSQLTGVPKLRVGSYLSAIDGVVRADMERWGFEEWVDDVYDGIVGEIEQRIDEYGGSVRLELLLEELPRLFGVSETSIRTYLSSDAFVVRRQVVSRNVAEYSPRAPESRPGAVQINGHWGQRVRLFERHFSGYSLAVSFDIAYANGIRPANDLVVPVAGHDHDASVIWRRHSPSRTIDVGRLSDLLETLDVRPGDDVVVVPTPESVHLVLRPAHGETDSRLLGLDAVEDDLDLTESPDSADPLLALLGGLS